MEAPTLVVGKFFCSTCKLNLNSQVQLEQHLSSRRHKQGQQRHPPSGDSQGKPSGGVHLHRCDLCGVNLNSAAQLKMHLASKRHRATLQEHGHAPEQGLSNQRKIFPPIKPNADASENGKEEFGGPGYVGFGYNNEPNEPFWKDTVSDSCGWTTGKTDFLPQQPLYGQGHGRAISKTTRSSAKTAEVSRPPPKEMPLKEVRGTPQADSSSGSTAAECSKGSVDDASTNAKTSASGDSRAQGVQCAPSSRGWRTGRGGDNARRGQRSNPAGFTGRGRWQNYQRSDVGQRWQEDWWRESREPSRQEERWRWDGEPSEGERFRECREPWEGERFQQPWEGERFQEPWEEGRLEECREPWSDETWRHDHGPLEERLWNDDRFRDPSGGWFSADRGLRYLRYGSESGRPPLIDEKTDRSSQRDRYTRGYPAAPEGSGAVRPRQEFDYHHGTPGLKVFDY